MAGQKREAGRAAGYKLLIFGILTLCVILIAVFAPYLTPYDPYAQDLSNALQPPGPDHLLGTFLPEEVVRSLFFCFLQAP